MKQTLINMICHFLHTIFEPIQFPNYFDIVPLLWFQLEVNVYFFKQETVCLIVEN